MPDTTLDQPSVFDDIVAALAALLGLDAEKATRIHFPDVFDRMARLERDLGHTVCRRDNVCVFLDELPHDAGKHREPEIDCSLFCYRVDMVYDLLKNKGINDATKKEDED